MIFLKFINIAILVEWDGQALLSATPTKLRQCAIIDSTTSEVQSS